MCLKTLFKSEIINMYIDFIYRVIFAALTFSYRIFNKKKINIGDATNCWHYGSRVSSKNQIITLVIYFTYFSTYSMYVIKKGQDLISLLVKNSEKNIGQLVIK